MPTDDSAMPYGVVDGIIFPRTANFFQLNHAILGVHDTVLITTAAVQAVDRSPVTSCVRERICSCSSPFPPWRARSRKCDGNVTTTALIAITGKLVAVYLNAPSALHTYHALSQVLGAANVLFCALHAVRRRPAAAVLRAQRVDRVLIKFIVPSFACREQYAFFLVPGTPQLCRGR